MFKKAIFQVVVHYSRNRNLSNSSTTLWVSATDDVIARAKAFKTMTMPNTKEALELKKILYCETTLAGTIDV